MNKEEIMQIIVNHTREVVPALVQHDFKRSDSLKALGANSIDRADIIMMTLETLSLNLSLMEMAKAENIGQLAEIIYEKA